MALVEMFLSEVTFSSVWQIDIPWAARQEGLIPKLKKLEKYLKTI